MKVLFLGWEFPPRSVGGLGTHSYNIIKALVKRGVQVSIILPFTNHLKMEGVEFLTFESRASSVYNLSEAADNKNDVLYRDIFNEVEEYKNKAIELSSKTDFDVIHANDWVTGGAAIEIKNRTGKKLIATIHSTEYDRTAGKPWKRISEEEKRLIDRADRVVTVSNRLKSEIMEIYGTDEKKINVIYNAINREDGASVKKKNIERKVVLYIGRLSVQKGIDNLIKAFKLVSEKDKGAVLYVVGEGSEMKNLIDLSINLELADKVIFLGRAPEKEVERLYSIAKVFVMPSVSEPFGIVALEAMSARVPTIISSQSGVSEVIKNTLKVDFWDIHQMADMIIGILKYGGIKEELSTHAYEELSKVSWEKAADEFIRLYER
jgi:glycosyltransferase involved in cell wall biosynthesis